MNIEHIDGATPLDPDEMAGQKFKQLPSVRRQSNLLTSNSHL